jgi:alpha-1,2-mannosyltransferase
VVLLVYFRHKFHSLRLKASSSLSPSSPSSSSTTSIAFFHPHCTGGGGGERVLWKAIDSISQLNINQEDDKHRTLNKKIAVVIYTSDTKEENYHHSVLKHVQDRFSITIPKSFQITFIHIPPMTLATKTSFTLVVESIHSMRLAYYALCQFTPDIYVDTTGCAFTFIVAKLLANCRVLAYVHYPTISTDMLNLVWERRPTYNNKSSISKNKIYTVLKLVYYIAFAILYGMVGSMADVILVNSTWTYNHIRYIWRFHSLFDYFPWLASSSDSYKQSNGREKIHVVYPPCDISTGTDGSNNTDLPKRENNIVSIGQFRPEKDHSKQIKSFAKLLSKYQTNNNTATTSTTTPTITTQLPSDVKLLLIGSCRNEADYNRLKQLRTLAYTELELSPTQVQFIINEPYPVLQQYMGTSLIGLHTMWNEHFGISIVEMMSNGLITIGHDSGGPKSDIITIPSSSSSTSLTSKGDDDHPNQRTGYLAHTEDEYVQAMYDIFQLKYDEKELIRNAAKVSCERFSDEVFQHEFTSYLMKIL